MIRRLLVLLVFCGCYRSEPPIQRPPLTPAVKLAEAVRDDIKAGDAARLASRFRYPEPTEAARAADQATVAKGLAIAMGDFGRPTKADWTAVVLPAFLVAIAPGTVEAYQKPFRVRYTFAAEFANYGSGYVFVDMDGSEDEPVLHAVNLALPKARFGSGLRVTRTLARLLTVIR